MAPKRLKNAAPPKEVAAPQSAPLRFLGYALPPGKDEFRLRVIERDGFELHNEQIRAEVSFLDFDGVVTFAGAFETHDKNRPPNIVCVSRSDLDLREREFFTLIDQNKTFVFLIADLPVAIEGQSVDPCCDLFRRIAQKVGLAWNGYARQFAAIESLVPEFQDFISRYGTSSIVLRYGGEPESRARSICAQEGSVLGLVLGGNVFFLPCVRPRKQDQAVQMTVAVIEAAIAYRNRMSKELPEWSEAFSFQKEALLRKEAANLRKRLAETAAEIDCYVAFKGALIYQSDPLVEVVRNLLDRFFGISLTIDERCIEDATLQDIKGAIEAVFEIKGVKGNFKRSNVNQVDSHRERLSLLASTPGVLIMNTLMGVDSLQGKDEAPHPDIIQRAAVDHVLLIRTLDLLRYADGIEKGIFTKEAFRQTLLRESGWLKVENEVAQVMKQ